MNNLVLMSIRTKYVNEIFSGKKVYEYRRKSIGENNLNKTIYIYSSGIDKAIVGYIIVDKIFSGIVDDIIKLTNAKDKFIREYFEGTISAYALHIKEYHRFEKKILLNDLKKIDKTIIMPQYYKYIREDDLLYNVLNQLK